MVVFMVKNFLANIIKLMTIFYIITIFSSCNLIKNDFPKKVSSEENHIDFVFAFFDAGETLSLLPVIQKMEKENISYKILPLGKGAMNALQKEKFNNNVVNIQSKCSNSFLLGESTNREKVMNIKTLKEVANCYHAKTVVTGMVSRYQSQLMEIFKNNSQSQLIGYFDGFAESEQNIINPFLNSLNKIFVPSINILEYFKDKKFPTENINLVGQPALDKFISDSSKVNINVVKSKLNIKVDKNIVTFIGGYGQEYQDVFKNFVPICKGLMNTVCIVGVHPAVHGDFEEKIIKEYNADNFLINRKEISTVSLVKISNVLISQRSTVGIQALFIGVPSIYFDIENSRYTNIAIQQRWSPQVLINKGNLEETIRVLIKGNKSDLSKEKFNDFIPSNAVDNIYLLLLK